MTIPNLRLAELVSAYAARVHPFIAKADTAVVSPLGMWLLLAAVAPVTDKATRPALEDALGCACDEAEALAKQFDATLPAGLRNAVALWSNEVKGELAERWAKALPASAEVGGLPSNEVADAWAKNHTDGLITEFPIKIDNLTRLVLATAVATIGTWTKPYNQVTAKFATRDSSPWHDSEHQFITASRGVALDCIVRLATGELVAVHRSITTDGTTVYSVASDTTTPAGLNNALDIANAVRNGTVESMIVDPWTLELGNAANWTVTERVGKADNSGDVLTETCYLPEWSVSASHDLLQDPATGMEAAVLAVLSAIGDAPEGDEAKAVQDVVATYSATGFSAAAITSLAVQARGMLPEHEFDVRYRTVKYYFDRPYAVVACTPADVGLVPLFTAWVSEPSTVTTDVLR